MDLLQKNIFESITYFTIKCFIAITVTLCSMTSYQNVIYISNSQPGVQNEYVKNGYTLIYSQTISDGLDATAELSKLPH